MRSNDMFLGLPHNFVQFMTLQEVLGGVDWHRTGDLTRILPIVCISTKRTLRMSFHPLRCPLPSSRTLLHCPKQPSDPIWFEMNRRVDALVQEELTPKEYENHCST